MTTKKYWCCWGQWKAPKLCGFVICECSKLEGKIHGKISKNEKVRFETLNFIWGYCNPQKWIPGKILILLDPHNLSVRQKLTNYDIVIFANCHCHLPVLASLKMAILDVLTSFTRNSFLEFKISSDRVSLVRSNIVSLQCNLFSNTHACCCYSAISVLPSSNTHACMLRC